MMAKKSIVILNCLKNLNQMVETWLKHKEVFTTSFEH
jgi:hypothetical protein